MSFVKPAFSHATIKWVLIDQSHNARLLDSTQQSTSPLKCSIGPVGLWGCGVWSCSLSNEISW